MKLDDETSSCARRAPYVLQVTDDSMAPEFLQGAIIIVDPDFPHTHNAYVVVDYDNETYFRQFKVRGSQASLVALNNKYPEIVMQKEYNIRGVITQQARNRRIGMKKGKHYI